MKKKFGILSLIILALSRLAAQEFQWAKAEGRYAYDYGYGITSDVSGNVYVTGKYEENAIFSGNVLPCQGNHDIFLAKYSSSGNLQWVRTGGGWSGDYARAITTDKMNRVIIAGEIEGGGSDVIFPGSTVTLHPHGDNDVFLAAYDLEGNLQWAKNEGHWYNEKALGVSSDPAGNVVICGYFWDSTRFNGGAFTMSKGEEDMFIAKYDANGNFLWMRTAGGPGREEGRSVVCDEAGNSYVCGMYSNNAVFGAETFTTASTPYGQFMDLYIAKYAPDGALLWVKRIVGDYDDVAYAITRNADGKLFISGEYSNARFGNQDMWTNGKADMFVACYDQHGNFEWVTGGGGPVADRARGLACDNAGNVYVTGQFGLSASFGSFNVQAPDSEDVFIAAISSSGKFLWVKSVGGAADVFDGPGFESGNGIVAQPGFVYVTGSLLSGGDFGGITLNGYTRTDAFVCKLSTIVGLQETDAEPSFPAVFPNPVTTRLYIDLKSMTGQTELQIFSQTGELVMAARPGFGKELDVSLLKSGIYCYLLLEGGVKLRSGRIVKY